MIKISIKKQSLFFLKEYQISTSKNGVGNQKERQTRQTEGKQGKQRQTEANSKANRTVSLQAIEITGVLKEVSLMVTLPL